MNLYMRIASVLLSSFNLSKYGWRCTEEHGSACRYIGVAKQIGLQQHCKDYLDHLCGFVSSLVFAVDLADLFLDLETSIHQNKDIVNAGLLYQLFSLLFFLEQARVDLVVNLSFLLDIHEVSGHQLSDGSDYTQVKCLLQMFQPVLKAKNWLLQQVAIFSSAVRS